MFRNEAEELTHVFVRGEEIVCTPGHPFYSPQYGWVDACELETGDILVLPGGDYVFVERTYTEQLEEPVAIYNFEVQDFHTYFVGKCNVLVHNACTLEEVLADATETTNVKGRTRNFEKTGGYNQALSDFENLNQSASRTIQTKYGDGKQGIYNGSNLVLRPGSRTGGITLEVQISSRKIVKI